MDCIPNLLSNGSEKRVVYLGYVETLASGNVFMPLASDLSLVCK